MTLAAPTQATDRRGFTLVELMLSVSLIALIALMLVSMTNSTAATWRYTTGRIEQFRSADAAFESITRRLSQATLNTYWDYFDASGNARTPANAASFVPKTYGRQSDLRFITGKTETLAGTTTPRRPTQCVFFQAPFGFVADPTGNDPNYTNFVGLANLLNTWGYYVEFNQDIRPDFIEKMTNPPAKRYRYRLMELMQPSNALTIYGQDTSNQPYNAGKKWFTEGMKPVSPPVPQPYHVLAENIIALVLQPKLSKKDEDTTAKKLSKDYAYDSTTTNAVSDINPKNQLPPIVQVTLVAIDEASANRLANGATPPKFDATLDTLFTDTSKFDDDLKTLQTTLVNSKPPVSFRVFTSNVSIRGAKWSRK